MWQVPLEQDLRVLQEEVAGFGIDEEVQAPVSPWVLEATADMYQGLPQVKQLADWYGESARLLRCVQQCWSTVDDDTVDLAWQWLVQAESLGIAQEQGLLA